MADDIRIAGLRELQGFLDQLPEKIARNVARGAMRAGARLIWAAAKANAPSGLPSSYGARSLGAHAGGLRESLRVSVRVVNGVVVASVKAGGRAALMNEAIWAEYGTKPHTITASGHKAISFGGLFFQRVQHPGAAKHAFMRPALDSQAQAAVIAAAEYMKQRLATKEGLDTSDVAIGAGA